MNGLLRRISISRRLFSVTVLAFLGIVALTAVLAVQLKGMLYDQRRASLEDHVEIALGVVASFHRKFEKGEMTEEAAKQAALHAISELRYDGGKGYFWVNDMHPRVLMHPLKPKLVGKDMTDSQDAAGDYHWRKFVEVVKQSGQGFVTYTWEHKKEQIIAEKVSFLGGFSQWGWIIGSGSLFRDLDEIFTASIRSVLILAGALATVMLIYSRTVSSSVIVPIKETTEAMKMIASADGDLTRRLPTVGKDEITEMSEAFNEYTNKIQQTVRDVETATLQITTSSDALASLSRAAQGGIDRQQSETSMVATAATEMSATVREIARSAEEAATAAQRADENALDGQERVRKVQESIRSLASDVRGSVDAVNQLAQESNDIAGVLDVIRGVAEQTNLLALNAAIEAARAGEQGRGFAVVADEVRTLASRTGESTQEIQTMIERLNSGVSSAVASIQGSAKQTEKTIEHGAAADAALAGIVSAVSTIKDLNTQVASAAEQQAIASEQIGMHTSNISMLALESADTSAKVAESSDTMAKLGRDLSDLVAQFKTD